MVRTMSKVLSIVFILILIGTSVVYAVESDNVIDEMGYLSDGQINELQQEIDNIKDDRGLEAVIVITDNTNGKSSMAYADDYYDDNNYGVGANNSGLLMLINMDAREVWISTTGDAISIFTDREIDTMIDEISPYLTDEKYDKACHTFLELLDNEAAGKAGTSSSYFENVFRMMTNPIVYVVALLIGIGATVGVTLSRKGKVTINNLTYEEKGSFALSQQQDEYIREVVTRTKIPSNSGSSTHKGSSGTSHGGGGGKF